MGELDLGTETLTFEGYVIKPFDEHNLWIETPKGEGATVSKSHFLVVIDRLFRESQ